MGTFALPGQEKQAGQGQIPALLYLSIPAILAIGGFVALRGALILGPIVVAAANLYVLDLLLRLRDGSKALADKMPPRLTSLMLLCFLFFGLISGFAATYLLDGHVCQPFTCQTSNEPNELWHSTDKTVWYETGLRSPEDAVYFSVVTITTVGYGDYVANTPTARRIVVWEILSGWALIVLAFPYVISRLASDGP